ncbi:MAG: hypothetical protein Q8W51_04145 [Candidatus Palauibacterales bacterium]|nr:hypothetical protein [Candidatus Palauibacterales bacterium]MDP2528903.1 hypothetical protein [Candidatus Palauibacterales bacterium]MDP2584055.1 hypothetical protein [Candidatus Palauibacterales bacterium]
MSSSFAPDRRRSAVLGVKPGRKSNLGFAIACVLVPTLVLIAALSLRARYGLAVPSTSTPLVVIHARDYTFDFPDTLPAGLVRLRVVNEGATPHHAVLTRLEGGRKAGDYLAGVAAFLRGGDFPGWGDDPGGPGLVMPGDSADVTVTLAPGHYVVACYVRTPTGVMHLQKGMVREFDVVATPGALSVSPPQADVTIELMDYAFALSSPITTGNHTIHVVNRGPQEHEVQFVRLEPGHTQEEAMAWLEGGMQGPAPLRFEGGLVGISAGRDGYVRQAFVPGDYLLLCFVPDQTDGRPHALHGMLYAIHVT